MKHQNAEKILDKLPIVGEKPKSEKEEKWLKEISEYEFMNIEEPGVMHKFPYGDGKISHTFSMLHGGKYKLPRHVARHLENCKTPIFNWTPDGLGGMKKELRGYRTRFQLRQLYAA